MSEGKVAPRGKKDGSIECPICFFTYEAVNYARCCSQPICTDCYLQIRPPRSRDKGVPCPFCGQEDFSATVDAKKSETWNTQNNELHFASSAGASEAAAKKQPAEEKIEHSSSIEERSRIEQEMRRQLEESRRRGDSQPAPEPAAPAQLTGLGSLSFNLGNRRRARARAARLAAENGNLTFEDIHALLNALPTDLHQVEELMVLEAMQASLEEEEQRRQRIADEDALPVEVDVQLQEDDDETPHVDETDQAEPRSDPVFDDDDDDDDDPAPELEEVNEETEAGLPTTTTTTTTDGER